MMRGYLQEVPVELEEAALVDGYSHLSVLWRVVVPMARNGLIATAIFAFVFSWNEFLFALVLTRTEVITFTVQISQYFGSQSTFWAKIAAMSVLGTLPVFVAVTRCSAIWCAASRSARSRNRGQAEGASLSGHRCLQRFQF